MPRRKKKEPSDVVMEWMIKIITAILIGIAFAIGWCIYKTCQFVKKKWDERQERKKLTEPARAQLPNYLNISLLGSQQIMAQPTRKTLSVVKSKPKEHVLDYLKRKGHHDRGYVPPSPKPVSSKPRLFGNEKETQDVIKDLAKELNVKPPAGYKTAGRQKLESILTQLYKAKSEKLRRKLSPSATPIVEHVEALESLEDTEIPIMEADIEDAIVDNPEMLEKGLFDIYKTIIHPRFPNLDWPATIREKRIHALKFTCQRFWCE